MPFLVSILVAAAAVAAIVYVGESKFNNTLWYMCSVSLIYYYFNFSKEMNQRMNNSLFFIYGLYARVIIVHIFVILYVNTLITNNSNK